MREILVQMVDLRSCFFAYPFNVATGEGLQNRMYTFWLFFGSLVSLVLYILSLLLLSYIIFSWTEPKIILLSTNWNFSLGKQV